MRKNHRRRRRKRSTDDLLDEWLSLLKGNRSLLQSEKPQSIVLADLEKLHLNTPLYKLQNSDQVPNYDRQFDWERPLVPKRRRLNQESSTDASQILKAWELMFKAVGKRNQLMKEQDWVSISMIG